MNLILIVGFFLSISAAKAAEKISSDQALAEKLKQELNFNLERRKGFKKQVGDQKIYDREREKGLALFLEEQEKFDVSREKGLSAHRNTKTKSLDESSPEYFIDLKDKENRKRWSDEARLRHVQTRDQVVSGYNTNLQNQSEMDELDLYNSRPRYDLRKRYNNKWVKNSTKTPSTGGSSPFGGAPAPESPTDFPAPIDYSPQPIDNFEEIPPPPPPIPYDLNQGYDSGFGDAPNQPGAPMPPPEGWDF